MIVLTIVFPELVVEPVETPTKVFPESSLS
jgi:hypothetical protein